MVFTNLSLYRPLFITLAISFPHILIFVFGITTSATKGVVISPGWVKAIWRDQDGNGWNNHWEWLYPEITPRNSPLHIPRAVD